MAGKFGQTVVGMIECVEDVEGNGCRHCEIIFPTVQKV